MIKISLEPHRPTEAAASAPGQVASAASGDAAPIRLAIVDDERFVIDNLCDYFSMDENVEVVLTASNGEEALKKLDEVAVDVVLSDIHMPRMGGIALLRALQQRLNPPAFIAMTGVDTDGSMLETLAGGGAGYIIKSDPVENIQRAITDALKGGTSLAPECLSRLVNYIPLASAEEVSRQQSSVRVSEAEHRVLSLLCQGCSNSEIADRLNYAESTVKRHVSNLMGYFDAPSRLKLVLKALKEGWN